MELNFLDSLRETSQEDWDALGNPNDPFTTHSFLSTLESSGSVGLQSGWMPIHITAQQNGTIVGALPLYLKNHSYGEYIFDWGWAEASERAKIPYYPKLVSAVPFTPATGPRYLLGSNTDPKLVSTLWNGTKYIAGATEASSVHILFLPEEQCHLLPEEEYIHRLTHQYHWTNPSCSSFAEWLELFRSKERKKIR